MFGVRQDRLNDYPIQPAFADLDELYENPEKLKSSGDPRFEVARELNAAVNKVELAWSNIIDQGKGSKKTPDTPRKFTAAELQLTEDEQDAFAKIAKLVQEAAVRYYFYQSPDAATKIQIDKNDTIKKCLELYLTAARASDDPDRVRSALFARLAYRAQRDFFFNPREIADLLDWADAEGQTSEEILPLVDQVESIIQSIFSPDNLDLLESNYFALRSELRSHERKKPYSFFYADLPWENERTKPTASI